MQAGALGVLSNLASRDHNDTLSEHYLFESGTDSAYPATGLLPCYDQCGERSCPAVCKTKEISESL